MADAQNSFCKRLAGLANKKHLRNSHWYLRIPFLKTESKIEEKPKSMLNYKLIKGNLIRKLEGNWIIIPVKNGTLVAHRIDHFQGENVPVFLIAFGLMFRLFSYTKPIWLL